MKRKPKVDESMLKNNPLVTSDLRIPVNKVSQEGHEPKDKDGIRQKKYSLVERTPFTKVFLLPDEKLTQEEIDEGKSKMRVMNLSDRAKCLYLYIMHNLSPGKDYIYIDPEDYMKEAKLKSPTTYVLAKAELCDQKYIAASPFLRYHWINPKYFFCGSRPKKYKENVDILYEY